MRPFEQIVADFGPMVLRVCRAVVGPDEAEDAWSETFLAALRAYPQLDEGANVEAWLVTIAHRKAIDATRAAAVGEHRVTLPGEQLPDRHPGVRRARELTGIGRGEGEQVAHLSPGHVDDAEALALTKQHGPPLTGGHP